MEGVTAVAALKGMKEAVKQTLWVTELFAKGAYWLENKLSIKARVQEKHSREGWSTLKA